MNIGFVGAGKVGQAVSAYLKQNGFHIVGFYSRSIQGQNRANTRVGVSGEMSLVSLVSKSDVVFITTGDDQIELVADQIGNQEIEITNKIFVHMSGAHNISVLESLKDKGGICYSLHPLQSFASVDDAISKLPHTVFSLEGVGDERFGKILDTLGNKYFRLKSDQKAQYHMAACIISNYMVSVLDMGFQVLANIGVDHALAYEAFAPLIRGTAENIIALGTEKALTGPIARGDIKTIKTHLQAVDHETTDEFYRYVGCLTTQLANKSGKISEETKKQIEEVLTNYQP